MTRSTTTTAADHISGLFIINLVVVVHRGRSARTTTTRAHTTSDATNVHWTGAIQSRAGRGIEVRNAVTEIMKDAADPSALRLSCGCPCAATSVRGKSENIWKTWKVSLLLSCPPQRPDHCIKAGSWTQCDSKTSRSSPETRSGVIGEVLVSCNFISSCMTRVNSLHIHKNVFDSPCRERVETSGKLKLNYQIIYGKFFKEIMGPIFQFLVLIFP